jgi:hypothetical protein
MRPQRLLSICIRGRMCWHTGLILGPPETQDLACELAPSEHLPAICRAAPGGHGTATIAASENVSISRLVDMQTRRSARLIGIGSVRLTGTTAARQEEESQAVQPGQMLKRHRSRRYGLAAYWSGGTGS